ncbi:PREDICTED: uncharacterized protein LOC106750156 [Dinoponera quadriceps]|uniref:Uncharacterized protein LOC106750156 n=1 Tax=Dinoponera quadriceps TaxID=609295 RepID=A0A6P3Y6V4_DINQU|nr:PREDICTED: uncharacterized protein LOC106750156 [Dinoponera quadriceps]
MADEEEAECPNNAQLFRMAISHTFKNIAESVSEDEFVETLTILKSNPHTAKKLHKAMVEELYKSMNADLEAMLEEDTLQEALAKVARLSEDSTVSADKEAWRPPGDVALHLRSLDAYTIRQATEELEKRVNEMERENETLMKSIAESRSRICATDDSVRKILDHAPVVLQRLENTYQQLTTCIRAIDSE